MSDHEHVTLELKCCCCGIVLDTLMTGWFTSQVQNAALWTTSPCEPCERRLALEDAARQLPADLRERVLTLLDAGVDVDLVQRLV